MNERAKSPHPDLQQVKSQDRLRGFAILRDAPITISRAAFIYGTRGFRFLLLACTQKGESTLIFKVSFILNLSQRNHF